MRTRTCSVFLILIGMLCSGLCGCGGKEADDSLVRRSSQAEGVRAKAADECLARRPSQAEGVYGCVTSSNDVGEPVVLPLAEFTIQAFRSAPPSTPDDGLVPFAQTKSDTVGFYVVSLSAGRYWLCTLSRRCTEVTVPAHQNVALNYDSGAGPGWGVGE